MNKHFIILDIETTGLYPEKHEIIELAWVHLEKTDKGFEDRGRYCTKIKPKRIALASPEALRLNGYTEEKWEDAPSLQEVMKKLPGMWGEFSVLPYLVCQNVAFDWSFLQAALDECDFGSPFNYAKLDTKSMEFAKSGEILKLKELCEKYDIDPGQSHTAMDDANATAEVFKILHHW